MALTDEIHKLESVWIQRDANNEYYEQINITGSDLIIYHSSSGEIQADRISTWAQKYNIGGDTYFDGNREITRTPYSGINLGTSTVVNFLEEFFFPFISATVTINSGTTYYETGSSQDIAIVGSVTPNSETLFVGTESGSIRKDGVDWYNFTTTSFSTTDSGVIENTYYKAYVQVNNSESPTLIESSTKTISFIYPYLWGLSTTAGLSGTALYSAMTTKDITIETTKYPSLYGTATYIYFCYPNDYDDIASIKDNNGYEYWDTIPKSFEFSASVPITSSGLTNDWMKTYKVYRTKTHASPNGQWTFTPA